MSFFDPPTGRPQGRAAALHQGRAQQPTRQLTGRAAALHQGRPTPPPAPTGRTAALQSGRQAAGRVPRVVIVITAKKKQVVIVITVKREAVRNWWTGDNVGYTGSGWGHGPRRSLANASGINGTASNLIELGLHSLLQASQVQLTGGLLNKIKSDPGMIAKQNTLIAKLKTDPRFRKIQFMSKGVMGVQFGGKRWSSKTEDWGALNRNNPALHLGTWIVGVQELTWATRHATVEYAATVKSDGTIVISYHLIDQLDLSAQPGRSEAYNNISSVLGFMYHDVVGGNSKMKINANWQITTK